MNPVRSTTLLSYRFIQSAVVGKCILPFVFSKTRTAEASQNSILKMEFPKRSAPQRIWFHAASAGELESLWPVILIAAEKQAELILTILSESASKPLEKLRTLLREKNSRVLFCGYCPWEGQWGQALTNAQPTFFVTVKYEAWPDLWMSLKQQDIPLAVVSASARKSLQVAKRFCEILVGGVPRLLLFPCLETDAPALHELFPSAAVYVAGEPRWDRVFLRSQAGNSRAQEIIQKFHKIDRPWGIIGSAWIEDLKFLEPVLNQMEGTLWIVPHRIDSSHVNEIKRFLEEKGIKPILTQDQTANHSPDVSTSRSALACVIVNEMGFLSELYTVADWAFVGGGWGAGVHSTIEPAIQGIPIGTGPKNAEKFSEIQQLSQSGQLTVLKDVRQLLSWIQSLKKGRLQKREIWIEEAQARLGASQKIFEALEKFKSAC